MYTETLGRWGTADLLIGLAYLARHDSNEQQLAAVAAQGRPFAEGLEGEARQAAVVCPPSPPKKKPTKKNKSTHGRCIWLVTKCFCVFLPPRVPHQELSLCLVGVLASDSQACKALLSCN
jgi:hypothetical protein